MQRLTGVLSKIKKENKILAGIISAVLVSAFVLMPTWAIPYAVLEGIPSIIYVNQNYQIKVKLCVKSPEVLMNFNPYNITKICLLKDNSEISCSTSFNVEKESALSYGYYPGYGYGYEPSWGYGYFAYVGYGYGYYGYYVSNTTGCFIYTATFTFDQEGTYNINKVRFYSGARYVEVNTNTTYTIEVRQPTVTTYTTTTTTETTTTITTTEEATENIEKVLEELEIKAVIEKILPVQNITEVKVEHNTTLEIKPKVEEVIAKPEIDKVVEKIKGELVKLLKKEIKVEVKPVETKINVQVIKIRIKDGKEKIFTKIEKEVKADKVIEVIPKSLVETADKVLWLKGKILRIIEKDPVFEVSPEDNKIAYLVEGNKTEEALETITLTYSYETVEKEITPTNVTQPAVQPEEKPPVVPQNVTPEKPKVNVTVQKPEKLMTNILLIIVAIILAVIGGIIYYLIRIGKLKIEFLEKLIRK